MILGKNTTVANTLLDSGSDTILIASLLAKTLKLKRKQQKLNINSAISSSKLVEFSICSTHDPSQIEVNNARVVDNLNLLSQCISKPKIQQKWFCLRDVPIDVTDKDVFILIGVDLPHLYICHDVISRNQNEPVAMLTKLGWILLGKNSNKTGMPLNHIT